VRYLRAVEHCGSARDTVVALLPFYAGLRVSEVVGLDLDDVALSARKGTLRIRDTGRDGGKLREVPLTHPELRTALATWLDQRRTWPTASEASALLLNRRGGRLSDRSARAIITALGEQVGLGIDPAGGFGPHILRHTFATQLLRGGAAPVLVADLLGDSSLGTRKIYTQPTEVPDDRLRITVIGGGPVALIFAALISSSMSEDKVRIRIYDHRWHVHKGRVEWKGPQQENRRRQQVVTVQSRQYTLLPRQLFEHVFKREVSGGIWPTGPDSIEGLPPLNIRISDLEDGLLDWLRKRPGIEFHSSKFEVERQLDDLRDEHLVVICDGAGSHTCEALRIFGQPDADTFRRGGRPLEDVVLCLQVKSKLHPSAAVLLTVAQGRFLLNPAANGEGFLNMRLTDDEALEVRGANPFKPEEAYPCTQSHPCFPERRFPYSRDTEPNRSIFNPSRLNANSPLWSRIIDGLTLFDVNLNDLKSISAFRLSMVERPRFTSILFHQTVTTPATIATLLGDAAISVHFWPGRGLNTGIASAASLATTVTGSWRKKSFREAHFAAFEGRMAQLQFRNQTRGFYGSMCVDDTTGDVTPIRDIISRSYQDGPPTRAQHQENRAILSERLSVIHENLRGRLPGGLPSLEALSARIDLLTPETVSALVASGPWDTYRPGGPEVDLGLGLDSNIDWSDLVSRICA
jgi:2-polyprenyl-6-methoxyphenol hydroxylase-like FAD-dependent oxidoreductase